MSKRGRWARLSRRVSISASSERSNRIGPNRTYLTRQRPAKWQSGRTGLEGAAIAGKDKSIARHDAQGRAGGLVLLVDVGVRPTAADVRNLIAEFDRTSVSFDPEREGRGPVKDEEEHWLELLRDGLTFDLLGLSPGPGVNAPEPRHSFGSSTNFDDTALVAIGLFPGPHLAEGAHTLPVVRTLLALGSQLARALEGVRQVVWTPAGCVLEASLFERLVNAWLDGGAFPAPGLVGFELSGDGSLKTDGLAFFLQRELLLDPQCCTDEVAASRLASRIIHEVIGLAVADMPEVLEIPGGPDVSLKEQPERGVILAGPA